VSTRVSENYVCDLVCNAWQYHKTTGKQELFEPIQEREFIAYHVLSEAISDRHYEVFIINKADIEGGI
jgi:hypothetical protein